MGNFPGLDALNLAAVLLASIGALLARWLGRGVFAGRKRAPVGADAGIAVVAVLTVAYLAIHLCSIKLISSAMWMGGASIGLLLATRYLESIARVSAPKTASIKKRIRLDENVPSPQPPPIYRKALDYLEILRSFIATTLPTAVYIAFVGMGFGAITSSGFALSLSKDPSKCPCEQPKDIHLTKDDVPTWGGMRNVSWKEQEPTYGSVFLTTKPGQNVENFLRFDFNGHKGTYLLTGKYATNNDRRQLTVETKMGRYDDLFTDTTASAHKEDLTDHRVGEIELVNGDNTLVLRRIGPIPHIASLTLSPISAEPKGYCAK